MADDRSVLPDGSYDVLVVDTTRHGDDGSLGVDVAIVVGPAKGQVVSLRTADLAGTDPLDLLALPATLTVRSGEPTLQLES